MSDLEIISVNFIENIDSQYNVNTFIHLTTDSLPNEKWHPVTFSHVIVLEATTLFSKFFSLSYRAFEAVGHFKEDENRWSSCYAQLFTTRHEQKIDDLLWIRKEMYCKKKYVYSSLRVEGFYFIRDGKGICQCRISVGPFIL